jgi:hypothetical protein
MEFSKITLCLLALAAKVLCGGIQGHEEDARAACATAR